MNDKPIVRIPKPKDFKPEVVFKEGKRVGKARCQAWSSRQGRQCRNLVVVGRNVCKNHGGMSPAGIEHGRYKHGRYAKNVPTNLKQRLEELSESPELMGMQSEIVLLQVRIDELLSQLDKGGSVVAWQNVRDISNEMMIAVNSSDVDLMKNALTNLRSVVTKQVGQFEIWNEIRTSMKVLKDLQGEERARLLAIEQSITPTELMVFIDMIAGTIRENVKDDHTRRKLSEAIRQLGYISRGTNRT